MTRLFANYKYHGQNINNLGDHAQVLTVDYLYSQMGVHKKDIVYIDINNLQTYDGPPVFIPVSLPLINYCEHGIAGMFSDKITPIFFGLTMPNDTLLPEEVSYYKRHEPIGCRDERAYNTMVKYGISAYLGGCLTVTLPKREYHPEKQKKVFIIDPPEKLKDFIPPEIAKEAIWDTHIFYDYIEDPTQMAEERYQRYQDEAKLMITGLLHGSVPCMAYGIPVILARDYMSYRFAWLESLLSIYTNKNYDNIDWNPPVVELEAHKETVRDLFHKRMKGESASTEISYLNNFYMNRHRNEYMVDVFIEIQQFIDKTWDDTNKEYNYAIWGLTKMAEITVNYIKQRYPNAKLAHVYDKRAGLHFMGFQSIEPHNIEKYPEETVFVTTVSAADIAQKYFHEIGKPKELYQTIKIIR